MGAGMAKRGGERGGGAPAGLARRRRAVVLPVLAAVAVLGYLCAGFVFSRGLSARGPREVGATPASVGLEAFSEVSFRSEDAVPLKAWWVPAGDGANGRAAILVHGWHGSRSESQLLATAKIYHQAGYAVLLPSLRAHGGSGGERVSMAEEEPRDVRGAISWLKERDYGPDQIVLHGWSMGAATVLRAAPGTGVVGVVEESGFADLRVFAGPLAPSTALFAEPFFGFDLAVVRPGEQAAALREEGAPLFVIHSTTDLATPYWHAWIFKRAYPEAEL